MSPQKMAETRKALFLLGFSLLSIFRFGREFFSRVGIAHHRIYRCSQQQSPKSPDGLQLQYAEKTPATYIIC